eukprot:4233369-Heterocapsa_arctica.AAC.1
MCYNCGGHGHRSAQFPSPRTTTGRWPQQVCRRCNKPGHQAWQCRAPRSISTLESEQGVEVNELDQQNAEHDPWLMGGLATRTMPSTRDSY